MALSLSDIPKNVGGTLDVFEDDPKVDPIEDRASRLTIPVDVGGPGESLAASVEPVQQEPAQPLSQLIPKAVEAIQGIDAPDVGIGDFFTGSERIAATPELGTLPELFSTEEGLNLPVAIGLLSTMNEKAQKEIIQEALPLAVFETTPDGSTIIEIPTEDGGVRRSVLNRPGFSPQDLRAATGQVMAFIPAAKLAGLGKSLLQKIGIGALGAGATEQGLQEVGIELGRKERDPLATGIATLTGGAAEAIVPAVQAFRGARQASQVGAAADEIQQVAGSVRAAQEATEKTGIPLFQGQQTQIPAQLEKQSFVAQLPAGTQSAMRELKLQNKKAAAAVDKFLGQIAPDQAVVTGSEKVRTAAQTAVAATTRARSEAASPIYKQAFRRQRQGKTGPIDLDKLQTKISSMSAQFEQQGQIAKNLNSALDKIENAGGDLHKLHLAKTEIDQTINSFGADAVGNTTKRFLTDIKTDLTDELIKQSPSYRAARDEFIRLSPPVTKIQESIIGKVANLDDTQLKQVSNKLFDAAETNPKVVIDAKKVIQDIDPGAWDEIVRVELEKRLGSMAAEAGEGGIANIPGQAWRALGFNSDKKTKVLFNALDSDAKQNLKYLQTALNRAMQGRPGGSQTGGRAVIVDELKGGIFQNIRELVRSPISTLTSVGEDAAFNQRVKAMAKAFYDPTWKAEMKKLRTFDPNSPAAGRAFTQLLNDIGSSEPNNDQTESK